MPSTWMEGSVLALYLDGMVCPCLISDWNGLSMPSTWMEGSALALYLDGRVCPCLISDLVRGSVNARLEGSCLYLFGRICHFVVCFDYL